MNPGSDRQLAHARVLRARGSALPPDGQPPAEILDSWSRCLAAGLDFTGATPLRVVEAHELAQRRERAAVVRRLAQAELETLSQQIAGSNFLLAFADPEGIILDLYADNRFAMSGSGAGIVVGSQWSETVCGTNGTGTALQAGRPISVSGLEHYFLGLGDISCTAAPVRDALGEIVGVLDASSYFESRQHHTEALVRMAATQMENGLLTHQMRDHAVLAIHPRAEFLGTLSAGLLAFDGEGRLLAHNARSRTLLQGLSLTGTGFEELFGEPFDLVLARLHHGGDARLRDVLGSALVARYVGRPVPRRPAAARTPTARVPTASQHAAASPYAASASHAAASSHPAVFPHAAASPHPAVSPHAAASPHPAVSPHATASPHAAAAAVPVRAGAEAASTRLPAEANVVLDDPDAIAAFRLAESAVRLGAPLLITGETGTGKEVLARHAHRASGRTGAFVAVNCGALPDELFESELFGHAGGAFTGARRDGSAGLIASADGGTLLLDEVTELPLPLQAALLRFLDDGMVRPVGGSVSRKVDVQLLAATNGDLAEAVAARRFRADLLYRLDAVRIELPPLRQRRDFADVVTATLRRLDPRAAIHDAAIDRLHAHAWPGNFRELRSVLTRALLTCGSRPIAADDVDHLLPAAQRVVSSALQQAAASTIRREYERTGHSVSQTSRNLGISRTTVYRHLTTAKG